MAWYHKYILPVEEKEPKKLAEPDGSKQIEPGADYPIATGEAAKSGQNLPMLIALLIAALALAVLIGLLISWAVNRGGNHQTPAPAQTNNLPKPPPTNLQSGH
ncbi:MAG TPA: hypothetical protein VFP35_02050 [Candidatus Saccharimonadales bacterium]|nr:hypothetical protein [Candidatus Saccharimonadales bacterium]